MNRTVKIILLQDIPTLGNKSDSKSVSFGYAKNWLIPQKLAVISTPMMVAKILRDKAVETEKTKKEREQYETLKESLEGFVLRLRPKKTEKGTLYAAIDEKILAEKLKEKSISVDAKYITLEKPIKKIGEYEILIIFSQDFQIKIKIIVQ